MIRRCPEIDVLEQLAATGEGKAANHVEKCVACQGVLALIVGRAFADEAAQCSDAELLIALGDSLTDAQRELLDAHLEQCEVCTEIASLSNESR